MIISQLIIERLMDQFLNFSKDLALKAGEIMLENFGIEGTEKPDKTLLTIADTKINNLVIETIRKTYPEHSVKSEEGNDETNSQYLWVCDPIDGTRAYTFGVPLNVFSIALLVNREVVLGLVYDPYLKRMYHAVKGEGAFVNGKKISVSSQSNIYEACLDVTYFLRAKYDLSGFIKYLQDKDIKVTNISLSSIIYCGMLVASGKVEACVFPNTTAHDCASIKLIVEEAGGRVTDIHGNEQFYDQNIDGCIISNGKVHNEFENLIKNFGI